MTGAKITVKDREELSLVVLAGGKSSRMGTDKADLKSGKKTFLEMQVEKGKELGIRDIVISGYRGNRIPEGTVLVRDRYEQKGPLGGLEACFRVVKSEKCLVLGIDIVTIPAEELYFLIEYAQKSEKKAVILKHQEQEEPLIGVYDTSLADEMTAEITERKGSVFAFLNRIGYDIYRTEAEEICFKNINTPEVYRQVISGIED